MRITSYSTNYMNFGNIRPQNTLQKKVNAIVQDINQRTDVQLKNKKREEHNVVARGMKEIVKKKEKEENLGTPTFEERLAAEQKCFDDWVNRNDWQKQLGDTYGLLESFKDYAERVRYYESEVNAHAESPEEEKTYWENALYGLKEQLDKEFENMVGALQGRHNTQITGDMTKEILELDSFTTMNYDEIMTNINHAQETLKKNGFCNTKKSFMFSYNVSIGNPIDDPFLLEYKAISKIDGYLEYGNISIYDTEHYVKQTIPTDTENMPCMELSDILGMEPGQWLNTQA